MKISDLTALTELVKAAQIPVALLGENRSITLGQILEALQKSVVVFDGLLPSDTTVVYATGETTAAVRIVWDAATKKFYGTPSLSVEGASVTLYSVFPGYADFYDADGNVRQDCLFIRLDGRLYYYNGTSLISAGLTNAQADQLEKLVPYELSSESELEALEKAGEIIPGQIYYIAESE